jgi:hypothetical protein
MKALKKRLVWTLALTVGSATVGIMQATAQDRNHDQDQGQAQNQDKAYIHRSGSPAYQQGVQHGQQDRNDNRDRHYRGQYDSANDRSDYQAGYDQGYAGNSRYGRGARGYDSRDTYGSQTGAYNHQGSQARQVGYQDGVNDGSADRRTGHSSRATQQQAYKHADHNYSPVYGDRQQYKDVYRQAYQQGYQQGYNGGASYDRR